MDGALFPSRMAALSLGVLGAMGAILSVTGIFGLAAYSVTKRLRELGIRMALGAQRTNLMRLVVRQGLVLALVGAVIGVGASMAATRLMASMLYGVRPNDPGTFATVLVLLLLVAFAACVIPARRAMRIDPMVALREE